MSEDSVSAWRCRTCGELHDELPLSYGPDAPDAWFAIPEAERADRGELSSDQCVIDGEHFFVRGRLEIPIHGSGERFAWLIWTTLSETNFLRASDLWDVEGRETEPPYFGWLSTELGIVYPSSTINLKTFVHTRPVGQRPFVEVLETTHPLTQEQRAGIGWARVQEIAEILLHGK